MSAESQLVLPPSFLALFIEPGRVKPSAPRQHILSRYELCEDMANLLTDTAKTRLWELGIAETDVWSASIAACSKTARASSAPRRHG